MPLLRSPTFALICAALLLASSGCSISKSSGSISDSISSISESSSPAEGIGKDKIAYRDDVATLTLSISGSSLSAEEFPVALGRTAGQHKITDWAHEKATYYGIGKGLKKAGIAEQDIPSQGFLKEVLTANPDALKYIGKGYHD